MATISNTTKTVEWTHVAREQGSGCEWVARIWKRLCEILCLLFCCRRIPAPLTQREIVPVKEPMQAERIITAYSARLRGLPTQEAAAEFHNVGAALLFSLSGYHKNALIQELSKDGLAAPYVEEADLLDKRQSPAQEYMQNCLFTLLVLENDTMDLRGFALLSVLDQLRILYHLYRIFYHTEFQLDIQSDRSIRELLDQLPQRICEDITAKAKQRQSFHPDRITYERCSVLIEEYIKPAARDDLEIAAPLFFALHENDPQSKKAVEAFSKGPLDAQALKQIRAYQRWCSYEHQLPR